VSQIRASCANDIRKRDVQILRLKGHLTTTQRGNRGAPQAATITISTGALGTGANVGREQDDEAVVDDPEYSLKQETTEFLTQLSQSLSDENDNLIGLIRSTLATLKELQGLPENAERAGLAVGRSVEEGDGEEKMLQALPVSYDALTTDMDHVLDNLRNLLTNPNFVPIEEVAVREEEITKLRAGWDKMEMKWREAIFMMDGWRKRMVNGGDTINIEDIKRGLGLGRDLNIKDTTMMFSASVGVADSTSDLDDDESVLSDSQDFDSSEFGEAKTGPTLQARMSKPLAEGQGNNRSHRKVIFKAETMQADEIDENNAAEFRHRSRSPKKTQSTKHIASQSNNKVWSPLSTTLPAMNEELTPIKQGRGKRLSSPSPHPEERSPKLTVQEKLNVAQAEAEAAAVAAGLNLEEIDVKVEVQSEVTRHVKKTRIGGRPRRRKSTLTPDELERLMYNS
jgi:hypothetical protein